MSPLSLFQLSTLNWGYTHFGGLGTFTSGFPTCNQCGTSGQKHKHRLGAWLNGRALAKPGQGPEFKQKYHSLIPTHTKKGGDGNLACPD
jgi:hypothetical protein